MKKISVAQSAALEAMAGTGSARFNDIPQKGRNSAVLASLIRNDCVTESKEGRRKIWSITSRGREILATADRSAKPARAERPSVQRIITDKPPTRFAAAVLKGLIEKGSAGAFFRRDASAERELSAAVDLGLVDFDRQTVSAYGRAFYEMNGIASLPSVHCAMPDWHEAPLDLPPLPADYRIGSSLADMEALEKRVLKPQGSQRPKRTTPAKESPPPAGHSTQANASGASSAAKNRPTSESKAKKVPRSGASPTPKHPPFKGAELTPRKMAVLGLMLGQSQAPFGMIAQTGASSSTLKSLIDAELLRECDGASSRVWQITDLGREACLAGRLPK